MEHKQNFQLTTLPWLLYALGAVASLAVLIIKPLTCPDTIPMGSALLYFTIGLVIGILMIQRTLHQENISRPMYLQLKGTMVLSWCVGIVAMAICFKMNAIFVISEITTGLSAGYLFFYLPKYIQYRKELEDGRPKGM